MRRILLTLVVLGMCSCVLGGTARAEQAPNAGQVLKAEQPRKYEEEDERAYTDVEATAFYGLQAGFRVWGGPPLRHGGVAARLRHAMRPPHAQRGMGGTVAASAMEEVGQFSEDPEPDDHVPEMRTYRFAVTSLDLRVGYHFRYVGLELGVSTWIPHGLPESYISFRMLFPVGELTLGPRQLAFLVVGVGSPELAWIRAWGLYGGAGVRLPEIDGLPRGVELSISYGVYMTPLMMQERFFGLLYVPIHRKWDLRASVSLGPGEYGTSYQVGLGFRTKF